MARVAGHVVPRHLVDDVIQDVLIADAAAPDRFDPARGSYTTYLLTRTRGRAIDVLRSETARARRERATAQPSSPSPELGVVAGDQRDRALAALEELPEHERAPIVLAFFHDLTYKQVALHLALPEGTVKGRIRSGLLRLRPLVDRDDLH